MIILLHLLSFSSLLQPLWKYMNLQWKHIRKFLHSLKIAFVKELLDRVFSHYSCLHVCIWVSACICPLYAVCVCGFLGGWVGVGRQYLECVYRYIYPLREGERGVKSIEVVL